VDPVFKRTTPFPLIPPPKPILPLRLPTMWCRKRCLQVSHSNRPRRQSAALPTPHVREPPARLRNTHLPSRVRWASGFHVSSCQRLPSGSGSTPTETLAGSPPPMFCLFGPAAARQALVSSTLWAVCHLFPRTETLPAGVVCMCVCVFSTSSAPAACKNPQNRYSPNPAYAPTVAVQH